MNKEIEKSILKTLIYADLFDYPLTLSEIWRFLINNRSISKKLIKQYLSLHLSGESSIVFKNGFCCLFNREKIINIRKRREKESIDKLKIAQKITNIFSYVPTVYFVGVSGNLAMKNADKRDDIDLFVIAKKNTLWVTRVLLLFLLEVLGLRRKRNGKNTENKICLNMLIDETNLLIAKSEQDLFSAHEVVQLVPVFDRNSIYSKFLAANQWVSKFLPNSLDIKILRHKDIKIKKEKSRNIFISALEFFAAKIQLWYMKKHRKYEIVSNSMLAFYPSDYKNKVLSKYNKLLMQYEKI